jgi:hypothetical protein
MEESFKNSHTHLKNWLFLIFHHMGLMLRLPHTIHRLQMGIHKPSHLMAMSINSYGGQLHPPRIWDKHAVLHKTESFELELGPSDPLADGPILYDGRQRATSGHHTLRKI